MCCDRLDKTPNNASPGFACSPDWIVAINYGRIGLRGTTKTVLLSDEEAVRRYVRQCLKKRESAPKRIGIDYKIKEYHRNIWGIFLIISHKHEKYDARQGSEN